MIPLTCVLNKRCCCLVDDAVVDAAAAFCLFVVVVVDAAAGAPLPSVGLGRGALLGVLQCRCPAFEPEVWFSAVRELPRR